MNEITKAIKELSDTEPSIPDSEFHESLFTNNNYREGPMTNNNVMGNQYTQSNTGGGKMFQGEGMAIHFGKDV
jgi:hypothetical protein